MNTLGIFLKTYALKHLRSLALGLFFLVATTSLTVAIPTFVEHAVDAMTEGERSSAIGFAWAIMGAGFAIMIVRTLSRVLFFNPGRVIENDVKSDLFRHLTVLPKAYFERMRPGELVSRGSNDTQAVRAFVAFGALQVFNVALTLLFSIGKMFWTDWRLSLWVVIPLLGAVFVLRSAIKQMFSLTRATQEELGHLSSRVLETYGGVGVLQSMNATEMAKVRFEERNAALLKVGEKLSFVIAWLLPIVDVVGNACLVLLLFVGGSMVVEGTLSPGELAAFAALIRIVAGGLNSLGWLVNALQRGWISLKRVYEVLDEPAPLSDAAPLAPPDKGMGRSLKISHLTFTHPTVMGQPGQEAALKDISFEVQKGKTLGIFGPTGSGKSTLLDVISRVHEPPPGTVFIDGRDVTTVALPDLRESLAYVPQDAWLFSQTLRENIALADDDSTRDEARVQAAVEAACLSADVGGLADGLDTRVGERGVMLSGGQRQRAALARAFYRDFDLLLLDDVLSAVDHATEKRLIQSIYSTIAKQGRDATTLIVSHRISALRHADHILVLEDGRVVATGTHDELLTMEGPYARAFQLQQERSPSDAEEVSHV